MSAATGVVGGRDWTSPVARLKANRVTMAAGVVVVWIIGYAVFKGKNTLSLAQSDQTSIHHKLQNLNGSIGSGRNSSPFFLYFINYIQMWSTDLVTGFQNLLSQPANGRPVPLLGWLGVLALITFLCAVLGNLRVAALALGGFFFIGMQGLWQPAMDTLALTLSSVILALIVGIPLGIVSGMYPIVNRIVTPVLDAMQTFPAYVYLLPAVLLFLIGPQTGMLVTLVYCLPPVVRLTAHGIRSVPAPTVEAAQSLGTNRLQMLRTVMVPIALRTIVIGVNQTILAALSMVTIAEFVGAPGLGVNVVSALNEQDLGGAFNAGLALVIIGIVLDRATTAAAARRDAALEGPPRVAPRLRLGLIGAGAVVVLVLIYEAYEYSWASIFPTGPNIGPHISAGVTNAANWITDHLHTETEAIKNLVVLHFLNPLQSLLDTSPWYITFAALVALAAVIGGLSAAITAVLCLAGVVASGLWQDSMDTLAAVVVGTVLTMVFGIVIGVWMGRSERADGIIRPVLDAAQVMPPFVFLIPMIALFSIGRFPGIVAAVVYAAPVAIKIVADGIRGVSTTTIEAAQASGSSTWQIITKVQLPMSIRSLALATNQGLIYVLSMVVVAGLVGAQALGFDIVDGLAQQGTDFGKGLAAGFAIVFLGIMLDRTTQAVASRLDGSAKTIS